MVLSGFDCCQEHGPCGEYEGDCDDDDECEAGLVCGLDNCQALDGEWPESADCCVPIGSRVFLLQAQHQSTQAASQCCMTNIRVQSGYR